ncbi:YhdP family protein [Pseudoalteromonas sp. T1lg65]|uniref:YhdP family protein n=1 Tax=Pseudoalteromonas sp. T1lg65 TaxID=2077101 RepID=UPI003F793F3A
MQAKAVCFFCLRKAWQLFAITLVTLAVLVSAVKYALPYTNNYRQQIETMLQEQFNVDMSIGKISASWQGNGPAIVLESLSFTENASTPIAIEIAKTSLQINLIQSIRQWQLVSNYFVIDGFKAVVDIPALSVTQEDSEFDQQALIEALFLGDVGHFAIQNSELTFAFASGKAHRLLLQDVVWQNSQQQHHAVGEIALPGLSTGSFKAQLAITGRKLRNISGDVYVLASEIDPIPWLSELLPLRDIAINGDINAQLWASINDGGFNDALISLQPSTISWQENDIPQTLTISEGQMSLQPKGNHWHLKTSQIEFVQGSKVFDPIAVEGILDTQSQTLWLEGIRVDLLAQLAQLADFEGRDILYELAPNGLVSGAKVAIEQRQLSSLWAVIDKVATQPFDTIPGIFGLRTELVADNRTLRMNLSAADTELLSKAMFNRNLSIEQLSGDIYINKQAQNYWQIFSPNLWISDSNTALVSEFSVALKSQPELNLYAELLGGNGGIAAQYFPVSVMRKSLLDYLNFGIKDGQHLLSQVLFSGPLHRFPFEDNSGQFEVQSDLDEVEFAFAPDWPSVTSGKVKLHFENERMDIYATAGKLLNQEINRSVTVSIENLNQANELTVDIEHQAEGDTLQAFFSATPLADPLANIFSIVQPKGSVKANVNLTVDLKSGATLASGMAELSNNDLLLTKPGIELQNLVGTVRFNNDDIELDKLTATWLEMPVDLSLKGQGNKQQYQLAIDVSLQASAKVLHKHDGGFSEDFISGDTAIDGSIELNFQPLGFNYKAHIESDLAGIAINLPTPYNKQAEQLLPLKATIIGDDISNLLSTSLGEKLYFNGIVDNGTAKMTQAHLLLADNDSGLKGNGFYVTIEQPEIELLDWLPLIENVIEATGNPTEKSFMPSLAELYGNISTLKVSDIPFSDVEVKLQPGQQGLEMKIFGKEIRTQVALPPKDSSRPIQITSDYLRVNLPDSDQQQEQKQQHDTQWLTQVPATKFVCSDCKVGNYQLDNVSLSLFGDGNMLNISELVVDKKEHKLNASGRFQQGVTYLSGQLASEDFGELMDEFDITSTIKDSRANIDFALNWQTAPYQFDVASLRGNLDWTLGEGHLAEISDKGARVFSLLSLDSLIRKLRLDFRDVFSKGFFYNNMSGTIQINDGIAYTQDTKLDGVPADLSISGYANLNTQEINYQLAVAPQVTSSLPVIMAWAVNPVTGLAALALDKVIHSTRVISEINFIVTGTMQEPVVTEVDRKSKEIQLPEPIRPIQPTQNDSEALSEEAAQNAVEEITPASSTQDLNNNKGMD